MASPQVENGHTDIANELLDAVIRFDFTKRQYKVLLAVIRKTYGWRKKEDDMTSTQLAEMTGLAEGHCRAAVLELEGMSVLSSCRGTFGKVISLNKDYDQWRTKTVRPEAYQNGTASRTKTVRSGVPKRYAQKTTPKDNSKTPPPQTGDNSARASENLPRSGGVDLIFPRGLDAEERQQASRIVAPCNGHQQDLLDELAALMAGGKIRVSPLSCLRGLAKREQEGTFTIEAGRKVRKDRETSAHPRQPSASERMSTEDILRDHARKLGIPDDEYLARFSARSSAPAESTA